MSRKLHPVVAVSCCVPQLWLLPDCAAVRPAVAFLLWLSLTVAVFVVALTDMLRLSRL
jgi:hypothetical protein